MVAVKNSQKRFWVLRVPANSAGVMPRSMRAGMGAVRGRGR